MCVCVHIVSIHKSIHQNSVIAIYIYIYFVSIFTFLVSYIL